MPSGRHQYHRDWEAEWEPPPVRQGRSARPPSPPRQPPPHQPPPRRQQRDRYEERWEVERGYEPRRGSSGRQLQPESDEEWYGSDAGSAPSPHLPAHRYPPHPLDHSRGRRPPAKHSTPPTAPKKKDGSGARLGCFVGMGLVLVLTAGGWYGHGWMQQRRDAASTGVGLSDDARGRRFAPLPAVQPPPTRWDLTPVPAPSRPTHGIGDHVVARRQIGNGEVVVQQGWGGEVVGHSADGTYSVKFRDERLNRMVVVRAVDGDLTFGTGLPPQPPPEQWAQVGATVRAKHDLQRGGVLAASAGDEGVVVAAADGSVQVKFMAARGHLGRVVRVDATRADVVLVSLKPPPPHAAAFRVGDQVVAQGAGAAAGTGEVEAVLPGDKYRIVFKPIKGVSGVIRKDFDGADLARPATHSSTAYRVGDTVAILKAVKAAGHVVPQRTRGTIFAVHPGEYTVLFELPEGGRATAELGPNDIAHVAA
eukprot:TRINITY_DN1279_c1_g2_i1.p1 TRINITY_DN1279_c1_g2~~TRINITY_DN1279_c1_g2_i1.p1  ORF type:complete len:477 (+),score=115.88 TRINITY_DN1279_c1_g2_i1:51-1481(+)